MPPLKHVLYPVINQQFFIPGDYKNQTHHYAKGKNEQWNITLKKKKKKGFEKQWPHIAALNTTTTFYANNNAPA